MHVLVIVINDKIFAVHLLKSLSLMIVVSCNFAYWLKIPSNPHSSTWACFFNDNSHIS